MLPQWGCRRRLNYVLPKTTTYYYPLCFFFPWQSSKNEKMPWHVSLSHFFKNLLGKKSVQKWWAFTSIWWCYSSDMSYYILKILINPKLIEHKSMNNFGFLHLTYMPCNRHRLWKVTCSRNKLNFFFGTPYMSKTNSILIFLQKK